MSFYFLLILILFSVCGMIYASYKSKKEYNQLKEGDYIKIYDNTTGFYYDGMVIMSEGRKCYMDRNTGRITPFTYNDIFRGDISTR